MIRHTICPDCDGILLEDPSGHLNCPNCNLEYFVPVNYSFKKKETDEELEQESEEQELVEK